MVNQPAEILTERLKGFRGFSGLVVGFDALLDEVEDIMLDEHCCVSTSSDNIQQGLDSCGKNMQSAMKL